MKYIVSILILITSVYFLQAQHQTRIERGVVSYLSSQNVYVKFESAENIEIGDTLFIKINNILEPVLLVKSKSSISCLCTLVNSKQIDVSNEVYARNAIIEKTEKIEPEIKKIESRDAWVTPRMDSKQNIPEDNPASFRSEKSLISPKFNEDVSQAVEKKTTMKAEEDKDIFKQKIK